MNQWQVILLSACVSIVLATLSWFLARRDRREDRQAASGTPGAPTVQQIWERQDRLERGFKASLVLLSEVAEQTDVKALALSKRALQTLADGEWLPDEFYELLEQTGPPAP